MIYKLYKKDRKIGFIKSKAENKKGWVILTLIGQKFDISKVQVDYLACFQRKGAYGTIWPFIWSILFASTKSGSVN